jgi:hypothetical protein
MAANILLKFQFHSIAREELTTFDQLPSLPFHSTEIFYRKIFEAGKYEPNKDIKYEPNMNQIWNRSNWGEIKKLPQAYAGANIWVQIWKFII